MGERTSNVLSSTPSSFSEALSTKWASSRSRKDLKNHGLYRIKCFGVVQDSGKNKSKRLLTFPSLNSPPFCVRSIQSAPGFFHLLSDNPPRFTPHLPYICLRFFRSASSLEALPPLRLKPREIRERLYFQ
ncbi:unnamed protein product [Nesidiocoris tenuis]|uniref:Uncharacterized protein n=1 Tax=Nesidiocoris tenuis TaxID=355587 RepID=A0A6H5H808_9HEMI|nr:unnamed protein product [Nesidiocoris tenuis]